MTSALRQMLPFPEAEAGKHAAVGPLQTMAVNDLPVLGCRGLPTQPVLGITMGLIDPSLCMLVAER